MFVRHRNGLRIITRLTSSCLAVLLGLCLHSSDALAAERRCGWLQNPTPMNLWLTDRDATWTITSQGDDPEAEVKGLDNVPEFNPRQYIDTSRGVGYGYGCACMTVDTDRENERIVRIYAGDILPLEKCRKDKSLPAQ